MGEREVEPYEDLKSYAQAIKGGELFAQRVLKAAGQSPVAQMGLNESDAASAVGQACGFSAGELSGAGRHRPRSRARILAAHLPREEAGISIAQMARFFGRDESTLVRAVLRLERVTEEEDLRREVSRLGRIVRSA